MSVLAGLYKPSRTCLAYKKSLGFAALNHNCSHVERYAEAARQRISFLRAVALLGRERTGYPVGGELKCYSAAGFAMTMTFAIFPLLLIATNTSPVTS
jgi:hypothetical protein